MDQLFSSLFSHSGRISRKTYIITILISILYTVIFQLIFSKFFHTLFNFNLLPIKYEPRAFSISEQVIPTFFLVILLFATIKRIHDVGKKTKMVVIIFCTWYLMPFMVDLIEYTLKIFQIADLNKFFYIFLLCFFLSIRPVVLFFIGKYSFVKGTSGVNEYGEDPLVEKKEAPLGQYQEPLSVQTGSSLTSIISRINLILCLYLTGSNMFMVWELVYHSSAMELGAIVVIGTLFLTVPLNILSFILLIIFSKYRKQDFKSSRIFDKILIIILSIVVAVPLSIVVCFSVYLLSVSVFSLL